MCDIKQVFHEFNVDPYFFYSALEKSTDDYIYLLDMTRDTALVSENMVRDFDLPGRLVSGLIPVWRRLIHKKDFDRFQNSIRAMMEGRTDEHNVEYQILNRKNEYVWVVCRGQLQRDGDGAPTIFSGIVTRLEDKGKIDYITGLFTQIECEKEVMRVALDEGNPGGIMLLGLDDFSRINALNNHLFGNAVLRQFAQTVQNFLPPEASLYRFEGDEFAVVYRGASKEDMRDLYKKIQVYCNQRNEVDGSFYFCTVSAGITVIGQDSCSYPELIKYASSALETSKRRGKNTYTFFSSNMIKAKMRRLEITDQLQTDIMNGMENFHVVYQPLVDASSLEVTGAETLLRWSGRQFGPVSPAEFIPLLENSGLIIPVGKWVLEQSVSTCTKWLSYHPDFVMNINISYLQVADDSFLPFIHMLLDKYKIDPKHIVLEMTESYFITNMEFLKEVFGYLRSIHIRIAMDDFGTGYSSLGMLSQLPADVVKIDRLFISSIHRNAFNRSFIKAVIELCHSVGIHVCVEGVEYSEELDTVRQIKADEIQGFYISKPVRKDEFVKKYC